LAISVIHNDREGARQLQHAVQVLADEAKSMDAGVVNEQIRDRHARLADLRRTIARIDGELHHIGEKNLAPLPYEGEEISPMELARVVAEQRGQYRWFSDNLAFGRQHEPKFADAEIEELRTLRQLLSSDLNYDVVNLPHPDDLPELARVIAAHGELGRVYAIEAASRSGQIPYMKPDPEAARWLRDWAIGFDSFMGEVRGEPWLLDIYHSLLGLKIVEPAPLTALNEALLAWIELHREGWEYELKALICEYAADPAFDKALSVRPKMPHVFTMGYRHPAKAGVQSLPLA
jgi:hypothetical protein